MDLIEKIIKQISNKYSSTDPFVICKFKKIQCLEYPFTDNTLSLSYFYNKNWIVLLRQDLSQIENPFNSLPFLILFHLLTKHNLLLLMLLRLLSILNINYIC